MVESPNRYRDKVSQLISWGHWFSFFNIILAMLLGTRYVLYSGWPETLLGQTYQLVSWVGHFSFLVFIVYLLIIFPTSFVITSQRVMRIFAVLVATLGHSVLLLDIHVYERLSLHLNPMVWELMVNSAESDADWQHFFVIVPTLFFLQLFISEWVWRRKKALSRKHLGPHIATIFALSFFSSHLIFVWADAFLYSPITSQRANFPLSYPMTAKTFMEKYGFLDRKEYQKRREEMGNRNKGAMQYPLSPISYHANASQFKPNLLIVMVDGLRADMLNDKVMPNLSLFAKENLNFTQHFSNSNDEMGGVWSLFFGLPINYAQSASAESLSPVLIKNLDKRKYRFALISSNNFKTPIYYQSIFGKYLNNALAIDSLPAWQADAQSVDKAIEWINQQSNKAAWFSYLNLKSITHYDQDSGFAKPFQPALSIEQQLIEPAAPELKNSYQNAALYLDSLLGQLFAKLEQTDNASNTIVIVTSDHGMEFNETETDSWGSNSNYSKYQLQVPLVIKWPNKKAEQFDAYSSHLDLVPTLMEEMFSVDSPADQYSSGLNLFDLHKSRKWILAGDSRDIAILQSDKTVVIDKFGNYQVFDSNYRKMPGVKPQFSIFMQVMNELKRFYTHDDKNANTEEKQ